MPKLPWNGVAGWAISSKMSLNVQYEYASTNPSTSAIVFTMNAAA